MNEAISDLRVDYRWQAIDQENAEIKLAREVGRNFGPHTFSNGDTRRQLLARSRAYRNKTPFGMDSCTGQTC